MICPTCGYDMGDSLMCPKCGFGAKEYKETLEKIAFENSNYKPPFTLYIVLGVVLSLFNSLFGLPALIFTGLMNQRHKEGNEFETGKYQRYAKILLAAGYAIVIFIILILALLWPHTVWGSK